MKITRLKRGYRISLSDAEFGVLAYLAGDGQCGLNGEDLNNYPLSAAEKAVIRRGRFSEIDAMRIDEDRRSLASKEDGR